MRKSVAIQTENFTASYTHRRRKSEGDGEDREVRDWGVGGGEIRNLKTEGDVWSRRGGANRALSFLAF